MENKGKEGVVLFFHVQTQKKQPHEKQSHDFHCSKFIIETNSIKPIRNSQLFKIQPFFNTEKSTKYAMQEQTCVSHALTLSIIPSKTSESHLPE